MDVTQYYKRDYNSSIANKFNLTNEIIINEEWTPIIATMNSRGGVLKIINILAIKANPQTQTYEVPFRQEILQTIINHKAIVACDASDKDGKLGRYQIISNENRNNKVPHSMYDKQWKFNSSTVAEAIIMLDLIETIQSKTKTINKGGLTICNDNQKLHKRLSANFIKES